VSISRRTSLTVRSVGVASAAAAIALGVAGTASACNIADFTASISCDQQNHEGVVSVHDTDKTRPVTITITTDDSKQVAQNTFDQPGDFTLSVPWTASTHYNVIASVKGYFSDKPVVGGVTSSSDTCAAPSSPTPAPSASTGTSGKPTTAPTTTPTAAPATSAAVVADTNSPSPSTSGASNLAETGGGSNTGMIAGTAAVLVAVGGGAMFMLRRRSTATRH
jgi:hypothetical protein